MSFSTDVRGEPEERFYLVKWEGYSESENTWENHRQVQGSSDLVDKFWKESGLDCDFVSFHTGAQNGVCGDDNWVSTEDKKKAGVRGGHRAGFGVHVHRNRPLPTSLDTTLPQRWWSFPRRAERHHASHPRT